MTAQTNVKTFDQLAALAKAKPKTLNYMSASLTKTAFVEDFNRKHGIDLQRVPFKGGGDAINSMMTRIGATVNAYTPTPMTRGTVSTIWIRVPDPWFSNRPYRIGTIPYSPATPPRRTMRKPP